MNKKRLWLLGGLLATGLVATVLVNSPLTKIHGDATPTTAQLSVPKQVKTSTQTAAVDQVSGTASNAKVTYQTAGQSATTATYQQKTTATQSKAAKQVATQDHSGETVKLTDGTTAKEQGVMGHVYVTWQKGNWSVTAVTDTTQLLHTEPTTLASQVNKQLKQNDITTQSVEKGAVTVYSTTQATPANQISWQDQQNKKQVATVTDQQAGTVYQIAKSAVAD